MLDAPPFVDVPIDRVASYWDAQPCNSRHSSQPQGSRAYFDEIEARRYFVQPHIPRFAEFQRWAGKRVLEIGCGIGTDTINFARAGAHVTAVDLSAQSLAVARRRAEVYGMQDRISFHQANVEHLSDVVPPSAYDLVYSFGVLHHTPHPERALAELRRHYVGEQSVLKVMVYHRHSYKVLWILMKYGRGAFWRLNELVARHSEARADCPITYTYSRASVRRLLTGFEIAQLQVEHIFPWRISDYVNYRYRKVWQFRWMPPPLFQWLERRFGWHVCVTARPDGVNT